MPDRSNFGLSSQHNPTSISIIPLLPSSFLLFPAAMGLAQSWHLVVACIGRDSHASTGDQATSVAVSGCSAQASRVAKAAKTTVETAKAVEAATEAALARYERVPVGRSARVLRRQKCRDGLPQSSSPRRLQSRRAPRRYCAPPTRVRSVAALRQPRHSQASASSAPYRRPPLRKMPPNIILARAP